MSDIRCALGNETEVHKVWSHTRFRHTSGLAGFALGMSQYVNIRVMEAWFVRQKMNEKCHCFHWPKGNLMLMFYNILLYIFTDYDVILLSTLKNLLLVSTPFWSSFNFSTYKNTVEQLNTASWFGTQWKCGTVLSNWTVNKSIGEIMILKTFLSCIAITLTRVWKPQHSFALDWNW